MTTSTSSTSTRRVRTAIRLIVACDFLVVLAPPLHWVFTANSTPVVACVYLFGATLLVALSLPVLNALTKKLEAGR